MPSACARGTALVGCVVSSWLHRVGIPDSGPESWAWRLTDAKGVDAITLRASSKRQEPRQNPEGPVSTHAISVLDKWSYRKENGSVSAGVVAFLRWLSWGFQTMEPELVTAFIQHLLLFRTPYKALGNMLKTPKWKTSLLSVPCKIHLWSCRLISPSIPNMKFCLGQISLQAVLNNKVPVLWI